MRADPADAVGVEAVDRLVEDEHRRVAEHGRGDAQPLGHPQREASTRRRAPGTARRARVPRRRVWRGERLLLASQRRWFHASTGMRRPGVEERADLTQRRGQDRGSACRRRTSPASGASSPRIRRIVVDFPAPFGPTKPVTRPAVTSKDSRSTATRSPVALRETLCRSIAVLPRRHGTGTTSRVVARPEHFRDARCGDGAHSSSPARGTNDFPSRGDAGIGRREATMAR